MAVGCWLLAESCWRAQAQRRASGYQPTASSMEIVDAGCVLA
ncbi:MAG: hypothetical protein R3C14_37220 [Caldilineaceae bacterium]